MYGFWFDLDPEKAFERYSGDNSLLDWDLSRSYEKGLGHYNTYRRYIRSALETGNKEAFYNWFNVARLNAAGMPVRF